ALRPPAARGAPPAAPRRLPRDIGSETGNSAPELPVLRHGSGSNVRIGAGRVRTTSVTRGLDPTTWPSTAQRVPRDAARGSGRRGGARRAGSRRGTRRQALKPAA